MYVMGYSDPNDHQIVEQILLKIGHLFQVQDDCLDYFGDPSKSGTDIEEAKCCWPVVRALELCDDRQRLILHSNIGIREEQSVKQIRQIYDELDIKKEFKEFEKQSLIDIKEDINSAVNILKTPVKIFDTPLAQISQRIKI